MDSLFFEYYREQRIPSNDYNEFGLFCSSLQDPLPLSFRIVKKSLQENYLLDLIRKTSETLRQNNSKISITPISFLQDSNGFYISGDKKSIRSDKDISELSKYLIKQCESGTIIRQELVSMIPAHYIIKHLNEKKCAILDLCAAPGSKSSQFLEYFDFLNKENGSKNNCLLIANDLNSTRAHMLLHKLKYQFPDSLVVTSENAACFPIMYEKLDVPFLFDAILADVPCNGDGTIRKNKHILKKWDSVSSFKLHNLQLKILRNSLEHLKVGGILVYSTCSFDPIQNEAVIAAFLKENENNVELLDENLEDIQISKGLTTWKIYVRKNFYETYDSVPKDYISKFKIQQTMFPPKDENLMKMIHGKCQRIYPHLNNSGGFFIAVMKKLDSPEFQTKTSYIKNQNLQSKNPDDTLGNSNTINYIKNLTQYYQKDLSCVSSDENHVKLITENLFKPYLLSHGRTICKYMWYNKSSEVDKISRKINFINDHVLQFMNCFTHHHSLKIINAGMNLLEIRQSNNQFRFKFKALEKIITYFNIEINVPVCLNECSDNILIRATDYVSTQSIFKSVSEDTQNFRIKKAEIGPKNLRLRLESLPHDSHAALLVMKCNDNLTYQEFWNQKFVVLNKYIFKNSMIIPLYVGKEYFEFLLSPQLNLIYRSYYKSS